MFDRQILWLLFIVFGILNMFVWSGIGKATLGSSSQMMSPRHCDWVPQSISCGGGGGWRATLDDADWPQK